MVQALRAAYPNKALKNIYRGNKSDPQDWLCEIGLGGSFIRRQSPVACSCGQLVARDWEHTSHCLRIESGCDLQYNFLCGFLGFVI